MSSILPPPSPVTYDQIAEALRALGTGSGMNSAGREARALLKALPVATLTGTVPILWQEVDAQRYKRIQVSSGLFLTTLLFLTLCNLLLELERLSGGTHAFHPWLLTINFICLVGFLASLFVMHYAVRIAPLQRGIVRLSALRPDRRLVPLLIEQFPLDYKIATDEGLNVKEYKAERHQLLKTLLPLWCNADTPPLTAKQRRLLLTELRNVSSSGISRNRGEPRTTLSEAEADFCLAALDALRYHSTNAAQAIDKRTRVALERLPDALHPDAPNRHYVQEAARAVLSKVR